MFNKGFVRAYAKHLGFNDEESVSEYLVALRQAQVQAAAWQPEVTPQLHPEPTRPGRLRATQPSPEQARAEQVREDQIRAEKPRVQQRAAEPVRVEPARLEPVQVEPVPVEPVRVLPKPNPPAIKIGATRAVADEVKREVTSEASPELTPQIKNPQPAQTRESTPVPSARRPQQKYPSADLELGRIAPRADAIPWKVPAVVLGVILVAAMLWSRHSRGVRADGAPSAQTPISRVVPAATVETTPAAAATMPSASGATRPAASGSPSGPHLATKRELSSTPTTAAGHERDTAALGHSSSDRASSDRASSDHASSDRVSSDREVTVRKFSGAAAAAKAPPVFTLRIRASETTWIAVIADGQPVVQETLIAPASTAIRAAHEITVRVGNASGVSFLLNGKEIPPQGAEAEVKTLTFDSTGLR